MSLYLTDHLVQTDGNISMDNFIDFCFEKIIFRLLMLSVIGLVFVGIPALIYSCYQDSKSPTFELKKAEWDCSNYHDYTTTIYVMAGKVMVPSTTAHHDCIQWSHK